jgi:hypothetical protein
MEIRLQLKTHYQVNRPGIFSVLLSRCTSPIQSNYPETISQRLANINFKAISLNKESAKFAVVMAQSFGFLTRNMFWDWKGHAINILLNETSRESPDDFLNLTLSEKVLYLKYYLEADGATILEICKRIKSSKRVSRQELLSTDFIDNIFIDIWEEYRMIATDLRQKVELRENIRKLKSHPYTYKTRIHKALSHIEPLIDFDLIERTEEKNEIFFSPKTINEYTYIDALIGQLSTISRMEELFSKFYHFEIIANALNLTVSKFISNKHSEPLRKEIVKIYLKARNEPYKMASISIISDVISATFLSEKRILISRNNVEQELDMIKKDHPGKMNYHVDMSGKKAFVVFSDALVEDLNKA